MSNKKIRYIVFLKVFSSRSESNQSQRGLNKEYSLLGLKLVSMLTGSFVNKCSQHNQCILPKVILSSIEIFIMKLLIILALVASAVHGKLSKITLLSYFIAKPAWLPMLYFVIPCNFQNICIPRFVEFSISNSLVINGRYCVVAYISQNFSR